jgi:hypothetical protein
MTTDIEVPGLIPPVACSNCGAPVQVRRPSLTGFHFCSKTECVRAKARLHYQKRRDYGVRTAANEAAIRDDKVIELMFALAHAARVSCECGRADALPGYPHPTPGWTAPCFELGDKDRLPTGFGDRIMKTIFPA